MRRVSKVFTFLGAGALLVGSAACLEEVPEGPRYQGETVGEVEPRIPAGGGGGLEGQTEMPPQQGYLGGEDLPIQNRIPGPNADEIVQGQGRPDPGFQGETWEPGILDPLEDEAELADPGSPGVRDGQRVPRPSP